MYHSLGRFVSSVKGDGDEIKVDVRNGRESSKFVKKTVS